jgi:hypothetical protein
LLARRSSADSFSWRAERFDLPALSDDDPGWFRRLGQSSRELRGNGLEVGKHLFRRDLLTPEEDGMNSRFAQGAALCRIAENPLVLGHDDPTALPHDLQPLRILRVRREVVRVNLDVDPQRPQTIWNLLRSQTTVDEEPKAAKRRGLLP